MREIHWQPFFSPLPLLLGAALLLALAAFVYWRTFARRPRLSATLLVMRILLIIVLTVLAFGPSTLPPTNTRPRRPRLVVMLDTSASMQTEDVDGQSRYDFAVQTWLGASRLDALRERCDVELLAFDETVRSLGSNALTRGAKEIATGAVSNLVQSLRGALGSLESGEAGTSLLLLTDGHDTSDEPFQPAAMLALAKSIPVHTVAFGGASLVRDVAVVALPMQDYLLAGEEGVIIVKVMQTGCGQRSVRLHLRSGDDVETRTIAFKGRSSVQVEFPVKQSKKGLYEYTVEVEPVAGEFETRNNKQSTFLEVTDERLRVLIVEGQPFWDTKFISHSLRKDERIELSQVTQVNRAKQQRIVTRAKGPHLELPQSLEDLTRYDVIILGTAIENVLDPHVIRQLPEFVGSHGGRLVFARGRAYDPGTPAGLEAGRALSVLEPVVWGQGVLRNRKIVLEPAGHTHPIFALTDDRGGPGGIAQAVGELPAWTVLPKVSREKVLTKVLARVDTGGEGRLTGKKGQPAVAVMEYERGLVASVLGEGLWRWRLLPKEKKHLAGAFDRFWSNLVRWLAMGSVYRPGEALSLHLSRKSVQRGDRVRLDAVCRFAPGEEFDVTLTVIDPEGKRHVLAPHDGAASTVLRQAEYTPEITGIHTVVLEAPSLSPEPVHAKFTAYDIDAERIYCAARPQPLRFLSEATGGRFLQGDSPDTLLEVLRQQEAAMRVPPQLCFFWDEGWILVLLLVWSGLEWLIRKKGGLL